MPWQDVIPGEPWPGPPAPGSRAAAYVRGATAGCQAQGCAAPELAGLARNASEVARNLMEMMERTTTMEPTKALWCEQGGHSFSEKDPDFQVLTITGKDKEGKPVTESRTICGPCAAKTKTSLGSTRNVPVTELPHGE